MRVVLQNLLTIAVLSFVSTAFPALGWAEPSFREAFEKHSAVMLLIDPESGGIVDANAAAGRFYGYPREHLRAMKIQDINQFTSEQVAAERKLAENEGRNFFIFRHELADGSVKTVEVHSVPLDFDGQTILFSIIRNISKERGLERDLWHYQNRLEQMVDLQTREIDRRNRLRMVIYGVGAGVLVVLVLLLLMVVRRRRVAEREVAANREQYRRLVDGLREHFLYSHDADGVFTYVSPSVTYILGYSPRELPSHFADFLTPSPINDFVRDMTQGSLRGEQQPAYQIEIFHKNGEARRLEVIETPVFDPHGKVIAVEGIAQDITDRERADARTLEAKDEAEKANKAKSEFLASMSHELRTPLNAVLGFAQMMQLDRNESLTANQISHVDGILDGGRHLLQLIDEVLDLARVEADQLALSVNEVAVGEIVAECIALTSHLAEAREVTIENLLSDDSRARLKTDPLRFKQVVLNLLSNACKFNNTGGAVIVSGRETDDEYFRLSFADTGVGISEEDRPGVFQVFQRLGADPTKAGEGTGIGLTVSKRLVERLAGRIGFDSDLGVGSTFWIELPLASNENALIWTDSMRVGVDALDKDHRALISLLNRVARPRHGGSDLEDLIRELVGLAGDHVAREEAVMVVSGHPGVEDYRERQHDLAAKAVGLMADWHRERDKVLLMRLRILLRNWLAGHVTEIDAHITRSAKTNEEAITVALDEMELQNGSRH